MAKDIIEKIGECDYIVYTKEKKSGEGGQELLIETQRRVTNPRDIWLIGNTGVRNPWRLPGGFKVYAESNMVGRLRTPEDQKAFKELLAQTGEIGGDKDKDESASITRKYRLMFNKFGFAYPEITARQGFQQEEIGPIDGITPLGRTFYQANTIEAQQECFLRGLIVPMEEMSNDKYFSPLLWVLCVMLELEKVTGDTKINFIEFATQVQTSNPSFSIEAIVNSILEIRRNRVDAENKKKFDREQIDEAWTHYFKMRDNFSQYADMNLRYLCTSGILKRSGRGIALVPECHAMAVELIKDVISEDSYKERLIRQCNGAKLPTDNMDTANLVLQDLIRELDQYNISYQIPDIPLDSVQNINTVRSSLKKDIDKFKEERYAKKQAEEWKEIYEYMNLLVVNNGREKELGDDYIIKVPKSEAAAYLEWTLWRAFLAIDHTINKPYESRGFNIDQDYMPVSTAPGGGPDMIFEFDDYIIVVEVTMSTNSRQEAMEGEPVRRHVADLVMENEKPVYGVFIANKIDSNTAETFRIGCWYNQSDEKLALRIVPFTLTQFAKYFNYMFCSEQANPDKFLELFNVCFDAKDGLEGPSWKREIETIVLEKANV